MNIKYTDKHNFNKNELEELFLSVDWSSGHFFACAFLFRFHHFH